MSTRYGTSPWIDGFPRKRRPDHPRFRGPQTFPVAIVGGGLAGCFTAYAFAAAGVRVALLEADRLGSGGAGRGPGVLRGEAAPSFRAVEERHGLKAARAVFEGSRRAVLDLIATARRPGPPKGLNPAARRVIGPSAMTSPRPGGECSSRRASTPHGSRRRRAKSGRGSARAGVRLPDWAAPIPELLVRFAAAAGSWSDVLRTITGPAPAFARRPSSCTPLAACWSPKP
jgi:glycine/D-amino acid oxidase-like deaminating enzyme